MIFRGQAWRFGDDVNTDVIIPVQFTGGTDPAEFARHCMEGIDPQFPRKDPPWGHHRHRQQFRMRIISRTGTDRDQGCRDLLHRCQELREELSTVMPSTSGLSAAMWSKGDTLEVDGYSGNGVDVSRRRVLLRQSPSLPSCRS